MFTINVRLSWQAQENECCLVNWCDFWFKSKEFPSKDRILKETKNNNIKAYERLNDIIYLLVISEKKLKPLIGDTMAMIVKAPIEDNHISHIYIIKEAYCRQCKQIIESNTEDDEICIKCLEKELI